VDTVGGLGDAARLARGCVVVGQAVTLARWIGTGRRPVTPGRVLRKADVPAAGPEEPRPFGLNEVNRRLAALGREP
jgi:hypothetical protein